MAKKRREPAPGPVPDGQDRRAEDRENDGSGRDRDPSAPDGISGSWK